MISPEILNFLSVAAIASTILIVITYFVFLRK